MSDERKRIQHCSNFLRTASLQAEERAVILFFRATGHEGVGDLDSAINDLTSAIRLDPNFDMAYRFRGQIFLESGRYEEAVLDFQREWALIVPKVTWDALPLAIALRKTDRLQEAMNQLEQASSLDEDGPSSGPGMAYHYHLGQTLYALGRYQEAYNAYTSGISKQPDYFWVYLARAEASKAMGNRDEEKRDVARVFSVLREDPAHFDRMNDSDWTSITHTATEYGFLSELPPRTAGD